MLVPCIICLAASVVVLACPEAGFRTLADGSIFTARDAVGPLDWTYEGANNWGLIKPDYELCRSGLSQAPLHIDTSVPYHRIPRLTPNFDDWTRNNGYVGFIENWGYGFQYTPGIAAAPSITVDARRYALDHFHVHVPSEHTFDGLQAMAEVHLVHVDQNSNLTVVLAIPININSESRIPADNEWLAQFTSLIPPIASSSKIPTTLRFSPLFSHVQNYWTYMGSKTTPPCAENIRFYVSGTPLLASDRQMKQILNTSKYSARPIQRVGRQAFGLPVASPMEDTEFSFGQAIKSFGKSDAKLAAEQRQTTKANDGLVNQVDL